MKCAARSLALCLALSIVPALALADPIQIVSGSFAIGRPLIGTDAGSASLVWSSPPAGAFETATRRDLALVAAVWNGPDEFSSTLLGARAPVQPLQPGPVPVGGTFSSDGGASFLFLSSSSPDQGAPFLSQSIRLQFNGGDFTIPTGFPPTDDEDLYILTEPFTMAGTWTVFESGRTLFSGDLTAAGRVRLVLGANRQTGESIISQVIYEFQDPAPIPEPSTLSLLAISGVALAARRRMRTGRGREPLFCRTATEVEPLRRAE